METKNGTPGFSQQEGRWMPLRSKLLGETFSHLKGGLIIFLLSCYQWLMAQCKPSAYHNSP